MDQSRLESLFRTTFFSAWSGILGYQHSGWRALRSLEWTWSGLKRQSKERYQVRGASVIELQQGKIGRESIYYDPKPAME